MKRVLVFALAILLVLSMALPMNAAPRGGNVLASTDRETMVIVQLWEDPVLVYEAQLKERGVSSAESVETYANTLEKGLNNIVNQAKSSGIDLKVDAHYTHTFFGFSAGVPFSQIAKLEKLPGVKRVFPDLPVELPDITYTVPQTGAPSMWEMPGGFTGEGITVAVIDTGIDYTHPFFWFWPEDEEEEPIPKVIGGYNFTDEGGPENFKDGHYHGTHVAGTIAADGRGFDGWDDFIGMAPDANLYAVRVLGSDGKGYSSWVVSGIEWSVNPGDGLERADVINLSLGASYVTSPGYPTALAANAAAEAGVIVVASAGNEGQDFPTSSAPSTGSKVISVASYGYIEGPYIIVGETEIEDVRTSDCPVPDGEPHGIVYAGLGRVDDFEDLDLTGKIALMQRGEIAFTEKATNAMHNGAIAAIIFNSEPGNFGMAGTFPIPAFSISLEDGNDLLAQLGLDPDLQVIMGLLPAQDLISDFSSAGPANDYSLKPDITAPGDAVLSTVPKAYGLFAVLGGTSMASPHVAGGAALLKQKYGDQLSVEEYKALLMNTSFLLYDREDNKYPVTVQGAGVLDMYAAGWSRGLALPASISLRVDGTENTVTVRNLSDEEITYEIEFVSDTLAAEYPEEITVPANFTEEFLITFDVTDLDEGHHEGYLILTPTTDVIVDSETSLTLTDSLQIPVYHYEGTLEDFFIVDFEIPRVVYVEQPFDVKFTMAQDVAYFDIGVYDLEGNYWGYVPFESGAQAGTWTYHGLELGLPPGHYVIELYAETTEWFDLKHRELSIIAPVYRLSGSNRFETATAVSDAGWETADTVILARADDFADSLAGVGLSKKYDAPILLTNPGVLSPVTAAEIERLGAQNIIILGGTGAVSQEIEDQLVDEGKTVTRIGGSNRFDTAVRIAEAVIGETAVDTAVIVFGHNFPDALAAAPWAASNGYPILMVNSNNIPAPTEFFLDEHNIANTIVVGGTGIISEAVFDDLPNATRIAGNNRYETSVLIAAEDFDPNVIFFASGDSFSDALTLAALAAKFDSSLLLVRQNVVPASISDFLADYQAKISYMFVAGGEAVVSDAVVQALESFMLPK
ncbi:MAG TPA: S8 family serine peptidase [Bacillota bacterium]|nr:S8 family serine peptidase [Bacillota bacterium]